MEIIGFKQVDNLAHRAERADMSELTTITTTFSTHSGLKKNDIISINGQKHKITQVTDYGTIVIRNPYWFEVLWWRFEKWFKSISTPNREDV